MIMEFRKKNPDIKIITISGGCGIAGRFDYLPIEKLVGAANSQKTFTITVLETNN